MIVYLKENRHYTKNDLHEKFFQASRNSEKNSQRSQQLINDLTENEILKASWNEEKQQKEYRVCYVGIIIVGGFVFMCYPKYLTLDGSEDSEPNCSIIKSELKLILKVLRKFDDDSKKNRSISKNDVPLFLDWDQKNSYNRLSAILFLLYDYSEYGIYTNQKDVIEFNGSGYILWDKTINELPMFLNSSNQPVYTDFFTRKRKNDDNDYFKRLHECILVEGYRELFEMGILDLFDGIEIPDIPTESLDNFGNADYIASRISQELNVQFVTHKQILLKALYSYIKNSDNTFSSPICNMYGTGSFAVLWEKICGFILNNQYENEISTILADVKKKKPIQNINYKKSKIKDPNLKKLFNSPNFKDLKLRDLIEPACWKNGKKLLQYSSTGYVGSNRFILDIVSIIMHAQEPYFIIFDAKYYDITVEKNTIKGQPGIGDIRKQYLYELGYKPFMNEILNIDNSANARNCFLVPAHEPANVSLDEKTKRILIHKIKTLNSNDPQRLSVTIDMLQNLGLNEISVRFISPWKVYELYLKDQKLSDDEIYQLAYK